MDEPTFLDTRGRYWLANALHRLAAPRLLFGGIALGFALLLGGFIALLLLIAVEPDPFGFDDS